MRIVKFGGPFLMPERPSLSPVEWGMKITKVISGGQTGVDRAGLDAALELGIPHGGWCPSGRRAEDGSVPSIYLLQETPSWDYRDRTGKNIQEADVTLVLYWGKPSGGTAFTIQEAFRLGKICHYVDLEKYPHSEGIVKRLKKESGSVLNVAGPRESSHPGAQETVKELLVQVLKELL